MEIIYDVLDSEDAISAETEALETLKRNWNVAEESLDAVKQYCLNDKRNDVPGNVISNIFMYVVPQALYIERSEIKRVVGLLCAYRPDPEHNLAIVFENEHLREIGPEDILQ